MGRQNISFQPLEFSPGFQLLTATPQHHEGAFLFSLAYIASKLLGLIRQVLFNALFGTGPQATAKPALHILFQHGKFTAHATALTSMALFGYAPGLPGMTATALLGTCFYALKDARTPLFTGMVTFVIHRALLVLLFRLFIGRYTMLAIPIAASITSTVEAACLSFILFVRLRTKIRTDTGWLRLQKKRLEARTNTGDVSVGDVPVES